MEKANGWWSRPVFILLPPRFSPKRSPSKLGSPNHERLVEHAALFQILDQCGYRLVSHGCVVGKFVVEVAVVIPRGVIQVYKAHPALDESACENAVACELGELSRRPASARGEGVLALGPVEVECRLVFAGKIHQLRGGRLHAKGQLVTGDAAGDLGVAHGGVPHAVQVVDGVQPVVLHLAGDAGRVAEVEHRVALVAKQHALIVGWQEPLDQVRRRRLSHARRSAQRTTVDSLIRCPARTPTTIPRSAGRRAASRCSS